MRETLKKFRAFYFPQHQAPTNRCTDIKTEASNFRYSLLCGKGGIRTPGASQHGGFQDRCNRPLYHLSSAYCELSFSKAMQRYDVFFVPPNVFSFFLQKRRKKFKKERIRHRTVAFSPISRRIQRKYSTLINNTYSPIPHHY